MGKANGVAMGVLTQEHDGKPHKVSYLSRQLDLIVHGMPACHHAVAAAAAMVRMAEKIVLITSFDFIHHSPGGCFAQFEDTAHDGPEKVGRCEATLLATENFTIKPTSVSSPAIQSLYGLSTLITGAVPHDCMNAIEGSTSARVDLNDTLVLGGIPVHTEYRCLFFL